MRKIADFFERIPAWVFAAAVIAGAAAKVHFSLRPEFYGLSFKFADSLNMLFYGIKDGDAAFNMPLTGFVLTGGGIWHNPAAVQAVVAFALEAGAGWLCFSPTSAVKIKKCLQNKGFF